MTDYYTENGKRFIQATIDVDMSELVSAFLNEVGPSGHILDAGCGSGRDSKRFKELGYQVSAFDQSQIMVQQTRAHAGVEAWLGRFEDLAIEDRYDGIWCCASLLHVKEKNLPDCLGRLAAALTDSGILYMSFKEGSGERFERGRHFTDQSEEGLAALVSATEKLRLIRTWRTPDRRDDHQGFWWVNALARKEL